GSPRRFPVALYLGASAIWRAPGTSAARQTPSARPPTTMMATNLTSTWAGFGMTGLVSALSANRPAVHYDASPAVLGRGSGPSSRRSAVAPDPVDIEGPGRAHPAHADEGLDTPLGAPVRQLAQQVVLVRAPLAVVAPEDDHVVHPPVLQELG